MTKNKNNDILSNNNPKNHSITPGELSTISDFFRYEGDELHIGKNSLVTKEENGSQTLSGKDGTGKAIPINVTNGSKLLINGKDVEQKFNNIGALNAALTTLPTITKNTNLACGIGSGIYGNKIALAGGCSSKVSEIFSLNYAASVIMPSQNNVDNFSDNFSAKIGFVWNLGK